MKITHITEHDPFDPDSYSGTPCWMSKSLAQELELDYLRVTPPLKLLPPVEEFVFRCKQFWRKLSKRTELSADYHMRRAMHIANKLKGPVLQLKSNAILTSVSPLSGAFLESKIPIVYWTDAVYGAILGFYYSHFIFHDPDTKWDGHMVTSACLMNAKLLIFSSQWAARSAQEFYGISKNKIQVVPFGANLDVSHSLSDVKEMIQSRSRDKIKLLFVGKDGIRKGVDIVLKIAEELHAAGHPVELIVVGYIPKEKLPSYVKCEGLILKKTGAEKLKALYRDAHFLIMPSRAETFGIVFCEANAFGVPCIATHIGGIPEVIHDDVNGKTFSLEASIKEFCDYIVNLMDNYRDYEKLALSAFNEYQTRLNWKTASERAKGLVSEII